MIADGNVPQYCAIHAAAQTGDAEAERIEGGAEETVHLVAPAATSAPHHLGEGRRGGDRGRPSHEGIQRLEGEGHEVRAMESRQAGKVGRFRAVDLDPCEIGIQLAGRQGHIVFAGRHGWHPSVSS
ncbi:hypothetical protein D3C86_1578430 [compost metagenome]